MPSAAKEQIVWSLRGNTANLVCSDFSGRIDVSQPHTGLHDISLYDAPNNSSRILGVHRIKENVADAWPLSVAEAYIRGDDLVAGYMPGSDWPFSPQLYWRANSLQVVKGELASVSLLVSVQTHLLDTHPAIGVATQLPLGESVLLSISDNGQQRIEPINGLRTFSAGNETYCVVMRPQNWSCSYVEIMSPHDFRGLRIQLESDRMSSEWQLFSEFLEKGVIRRARVHAVLLPRENDIELAAVCCAAARKSELPLTT